MQAIYCHTGGTTCLFWPVEKMGRFIKAKKVIYNCPDDKHDQNQASFMEHPTNP